MHQTLQTEIEHGISMAKVTQEYADCPIVAKTEDGRPAEFNGDVTAEIDFRKLNQIYQSNSGSFWKSIAAQYSCLGLEKEQEAQNLEIAFFEHLRMQWLAQKDTSR